MTRRDVLFQILWCLGSATVSDAFIPGTVGRFPIVPPVASTAIRGNDLGSNTVHKENFDIVRVDLDDGRDYPIYIGTGYSEEQGASECRTCWGRDIILLFSHCRIPLLVRSNTVSL